MNMIKSILWVATTSFFTIGASVFSASIQAAEVDVAIIYDDATKEYYNGSPSTAIIAMVDQANTYLANSQVDIQLKIVATENMNLILDQEDKELSDFRKNTQVKALREKSGADFVTFISDSFSGCGIGYVTTNPSYSFNIIRRNCMARSYLHEMGHNMGLGHSIAQESKGSTYSWGIGYGVEGVFSTVMAYESAYNTRKRTYLLSNPNYKCSGNTCGIKNKADAAKALNNVKNKVASHRESITSTKTAAVETGKVSIIQKNTVWTSVNFDSEFSSAPVVVMGPASRNGGSPVTVRTRNVTQKGFEFQLDEWDYLDGSHTNETVSWLATTAGEHNWDGLQVYVGKTSNVTQKWKSVSFGDNITTTPVILAQKEVANNNSASTIRMRNSSSNGVDFFLEEEQANDGIVTGDSIHYIAITSGIGKVGNLKIQAGLTGKSVTDSWSNIDFTGNFENAKILSNIQTYIGTDTAALRYQSLSASGVQIRLEEEKSDDDETTHIAENVGWLVIGE